MVRPNPSWDSAANGIFVALAFLIRSGVILIIGAMGDMFSLQTAFLVAAFVAMLAVPAFFWLPDPEFEPST